MQTDTLAALQQRFTRSAIAAFAAYGLGILLLFLSQVVLARVLGIDEYGVYTYALSWLGILVLIGKLGLDHSLQRFLPQYRASNEWGYCRGVLARSFQIGVIASVLLVPVVLFFNRSLLSGLDTIPDGITLAMVAIIPFWVLLKVNVGALLAFGRPVFAQLTENIAPPAVMIAGAALFTYLVPGQANALSMLVLFLLALAIALLTGVILLAGRALPRQIVAAAAQYDTRHWLAVALPLFVMSGMYVIMGYTDIVMLGAMSSTTESGIYAASSRIAAFVTMPLIFMNTVLSPYISGLFHSGQHRELQHVVSFTSRVAGALALPACIVLVLFGNFFLGLFGAGFEAGKGAMNLLLFGQLVNVLSGSVGMLLSMTGRHLFASATVTVCALLNVLLNYLLIPRYGLEGAALATTVTTVLWNIAFVFRVRSVLDIRPTFICAVGMKR